jgi:hypothetical protein
MPIIIGPSEKYTIFIQSGAWRQLINGNPGYFAAASLCTEKKLYPIYSALINNIQYKIIVNTIVLVKDANFRIILNIIDVVNNPNAQAINGNELKPHIFGKFLLYEYILFPKSIQIKLINNATNRYIKYCLYILVC